jgi:LacI family transcriptional regulator
LGKHIHDLDVIAAGSDAMAVGVIARLRELGISSPGDIEVSGFDHVPMLSDVLPGFSTVEVPLEAFGEAALHLAVDEDGAASSGISLPASLIVHGVRVDVARD